MLSSRYTSLGTPSAPSTRSASDAQSSARSTVRAPALRSSSSSRTSTSPARATCFSRTSSRRTRAPGGTERIRPASTRTSACVAKSATSSRASHSPSSAYAARPPRSPAAAFSSTFSKTSSRVCANVSSSSAEEGPLGISTARVTPVLTWEETCVVFRTFRAVSRESISRSRRRRERQRRRRASARREPPPRADDGRDALVVRSVVRRTRLSTASFGAYLQRARAHGGGPLRGSGGGDRAGLSAPQLARRVRLAGRAVGCEGARVRVSLDRIGNACFYVAIRGRRCRVGSYARA